MLPCPFCGGPAEHQFGMGEHWFLCVRCKASSSMESDYDKSKAAWNQRTP